MATTSTIVRCVRVLATVTLSLALLPALATNSQAAKFSSGSYSYTLDGNNATLTQTSIMGGDVVIPATIDGHPVVRLGRDLFYGVGITSVKFPESLQVIQWGAFEDNNLSEVVFPSKLGTIGSYAFAHNRITKLTFTGNSPNADKTVIDYDRQIQVSALDTSIGFANGWHTYPVTTVSPFLFTTTSTSAEITGYLGAVPADLTIPALLNGRPVTSIASYAFTDKPFATLTLTSSVESIGDLAFARCGITELRLSEGLLTIGKSALAGNSFSTVIVPASVRNIGDYAFAFNTVASMQMRGDAPVLGVTPLFMAGAITLSVYSSASGYGDTFGGFIVNRIDSLSIDATLAHLVTNVGTLSPSFTGFGLSYSLTGLTVTDSAFALTATSNESHATITINGQNVASGLRSSDIDLVAGVAQSVDVVVTAQDGTTSRTYTVSVTPPQGVYSVTYEYNSATNGADLTCSLFTVGGTGVTLPTPTRTGYVFAGWYSDVALTSKIGNAGGNYVPTADTGAFAKWNPDTYTVTYNYNSATGGTTPVTARFTVGGTGVTLPTPTRTGYVFAGWYSDAGLTSRIGDAGASYSPSSSGSAYASWDAENYTMTYNYNSATSGNGLASSGSTFGGMPIGLPSPARTKYVFAGWYSDSGFTSRIGGAGDSYSLSANGQAYAKWTAIYTVTFAYGSATSGNSVVSAQFTAGGTPITLQSPTRTAYTFNGWYSDSALTLRIGGAGDSYSPIADGSVYAKWTLTPLSPVASTKPSISGKTISTSSGKNQLTVVRGVWKGTPTPTYTYQWYSCTAPVSLATQVIPRTCARISSRTSTTLSVTSDLKNKHVTVAVTATSQGAPPTVWVAASTAKIS